MSTFIAAASSKGSPNILLLVLPVAVYFGMYRPRKKQMKRQQEVNETMSVGTGIVLTSGIYGTIQSIDSEIADVEISPGVTIRVDRRAVARVATKPVEVPPTLTSPPPTEASA
jgi:preprotein translocase subunit YajC